jgi:hypothetical protein
MTATASPSAKPRAIVIGGGITLFGGFVIVLKAIAH